MTSYDHDAVRREASTPLPSFPGLHGSGTHLTRLEGPGTPEPAETGLPGLPVTGDEVSFSTKLGGCVWCKQPIALGLEAHGTCLEKSGFKPLSCWWCAACGQYRVGKLGDYCQTCSPTVRQHPLKHDKIVLQPSNDQEAVFAKGCAAAFEAYCKRNEAQAALLGIIEQLEQLSAPSRPASHVALDAYYAAQDGGSTP